MVFDDAMKPTVSNAILYRQKRFDNNVRSSAATSSSSTVALQSTIGRQPPRTTNGHHYRGSRNKAQEDSETDDDGATTTSYQQYPIATAHVITSDSIALPPVASQQPVMAAIAASRRKRSSVFNRTASFIFSSLYQKPKQLGKNSLSHANIVKAINVDAAERSKSPVDSKQPSIASTNVSSLSSAVIRQQQQPPYIRRAGGSFNRANPTAGRISFIEAEQKAALSQVSLQEFWREYSRAQRAAEEQRHKESTTKSRGYSALDWEAEWKRAQLSRHILLGRALPDGEQKLMNDSYKTPHMIVQQSTTTKLTKVQRQPTMVSGDQPESSSEKLPSKFKTPERSEKARKRLLRQLKRRENARKFIATKLAEATALPAGDDDSASVMSGTSGASANEAGSKPQSIDAGIVINDEEELRQIFMESEVSFVFCPQQQLQQRQTTTLSELPNEEPNLLPLGSTSEPLKLLSIDEAPIVAKTNEDTELTMKQALLEDSSSLSTLGPQQQPDVIIEPPLSSPPPPSTNEVSEVSAASHQNSQFHPQRHHHHHHHFRASSFITQLGAGSEQAELRLAISIAANAVASSGANSPSSMPSSANLHPPLPQPVTDTPNTDDQTSPTAPSSSSSSPPQNLTLTTAPAADLCNICGTPLTPYGSVYSSGSKRGSIKRNSKVIANNSGQFYGSGTGISSKSALVNWFATRMTSDQMLMVASFEDETANFLLANPRQTVLNSAQQAQSTPCGWLPNAKLSGYMNAPVKRRAGGSQQGSNQSSLRSNYFGYHDSRRKLPTSGIFRHYQTPEEHARYYRLQFTVGDAGRYAEMWRQSIDPNRSLSDPTRPVDDMLLLGSSAQTKHFTLNQTFHDGSEDGVVGGGAPGRGKHHRPKHHRNATSLSGVDKASPDESLLDDKRDTSGEKIAPLKMRQTTSDAVGVASGPVLVWPPHQHPAPVVTVSNAASQVAPAPPGPWPIRPWTLAQLEGKKVMNTKVSILTNTIKNDDTPTSAGPSVFALQPLTTSKETKEGSGSQPGSGNGHQHPHSLLTNSQSTPALSILANNSNNNVPPVLIKAAGKTLANSRTNSQTYLGSSLEVQPLFKEDIEAFEAKKNKPGILAKHRIIEKAYRRVGKLSLPLPSLPNSAPDVKNLLVSDKPLSHGVESSYNSKNGTRTRPHHNNSRVKLLPIEQSADNELEPLPEPQQHLPHSSLLSTSVRPRSSNLPKNNSANSLSSLSSSGQNSGSSSIPLTNLVPFHHKNSLPNPITTPVVAEPTMQTSSLLLKTAPSLASLLAGGTNGASVSNGLSLFSRASESNRSFLYPKNWSSSSSNDVTAALQLDEPSSVTKYFMFQAQISDSANINTAGLSPRPKLLVNNNGS